MADAKVLFAGLGTGSPFYYRCLLPAQTLGADYVGLNGEPPEIYYATGIAQGKSRVPDFADYELIVLQQPRAGWHKLIRSYQKHGIKVLFETDDYLHGIRNVRDHDFRQGFTKPHLAELELSMRLCDGIICSTEAIERRYRKFNRNTFVCENGVDVARYDLTLPERPTINGRSTVTIGWAGATAHAAAVGPWLESVRKVMREHEHVGFASVGLPVANRLKEEFGNRTIAVPFAAIEQYPAAMTMFDVALAPAGQSAFHQGKSDLRWLEASALGIPVVGDAWVYGEIEDGVTGFVVEKPEDVGAHLERLVVDDELRTSVGATARRYVRRHRSIKTLATQWSDVFNEVLGRDV